MLRSARLALAGAALLTALTATTASADVFVPDAAGYHARSAVWSGSRFVAPLDGQPRVTTPFGEKGPYWKTGYHPGLDLRAAIGTPVKAIADGVVVGAGSEGWNGGYGHYVEVDHGDGLASLYAHLSELNVEVGQSVRGGDLLALSGNTGASTGPHLHLEVREHGVKKDPASYIGR
jgi:murein DD-endopeptidase MepM/ murein hydrolase activator NlpD